jgi:hypothetical protein
MERYKNNYEMKTKVINRQKNDDHALNSLALVV